MFTDACFEVIEAPVPEPGEGEAVVKIEYFSLDPAMRGWVRDERSYLPPIELGAVMRSGAAGRVIASKNPSLPVGAGVMGMLGWQEYALIGGGTGAMANVLPEGVDLVDALSIFGSTGVCRRRQVGRHHQCGDDGVAAQPGKPESHPLFLSAKVARAAGGAPREPESH